MLKMCDNQDPCMRRWFIRWVGSFVISLNEPSHTALPLHDHHHPSVHSGRIAQALQLLPQCHQMVAGLQYAIAELAPPLRTER